MNFPIDVASLLVGLVAAAAPQDFVFPDDPRLSQPPAPTSKPRISLSDLPKCLGFGKFKFTMSGAPVCELPSLRLCEYPVSEKNKSGKRSLEAPLCIVLITDGMVRLARKTAAARILSRGRTDALSARARRTFSAAASRGLCMRTLNGQGRG